MKIDGYCNALRYDGPGDLFPARCGYMFGHELPNHRVRNDGYHCDVIWPRDNDADD